MDLVNIIYCYVNRFINSDELISLLKNIDKNNFSNKENKEIVKLIEDVKEIVLNISIELDEFEIRRIKTLNRILTNLEKIIANNDNNADTIEFARKQYDKLKKDKEKIRDSGPKYEKLYKLLINNSVYLKYFEKMSDLEFLEFITHFIQTPFPPKINQELFDDLVRVGIKQDKREALWRLAVNYNGKGKDFTNIENYFIEKKDDYYLIELISVVKEDLNIEELIKKVINTNDKKFMINCYNRAKKLSLFTDEELKKIKDMMKN